MNHEFLTAAVYSIYKTEQCVENVYVGSTQARLSERHTSVYDPTSKSVEALARPRPLFLPILF